MTLQILLFLVDAFLLNAAFLLSFPVRYGLNIPEINFLPYKDNFPFLTFIYIGPCFYTRFQKKVLFLSYHILAIELIMEE